MLQMCIRDRLNSFSSYEENAQYESGINILVGGNSLGRGVTFPQLQTIIIAELPKVHKQILCGSMRECLDMIEIRNL